MDPNNPQNQNFDPQQQQGGYYPPQQPLQQSYQQQTPLPPPPQPSYTPPTTMPQQAQNPYMPQQPYAPMPQFEATPDVSNAYYGTPPTQAPGINMRVIGIIVAAAVLLIGAVLVISLTLGGGSLKKYDSGFNFSISIPDGWKTEEYDGETIDQVKAYESGNGQDTPPIGASMSILKTSQSFGYSSKEDFFAGLTTSHEQVKTTGTALGGTIVNSQVEEITVGTRSLLSITYELDFGGETGTGYYATYYEFVDENTQLIYQFTYLANGTDMADKIVPILESYQEL